MKHIFRTTHPSLRDYLMLGIFAAIYLMAMVLIIAPSAVIGQ